jgi:AcrR family transcriptional regulator
MAGGRDKEDPSVLSDGVRGRKRSNSRTVQVDEFGLQPGGPALRQATHQHSLEPARVLKVFPRSDDAIVRKVVKAAGVIVMTVSQDDGGKVAGRIDRHGLESWSYLFDRSDFDHYLLEERVPAGEIAPHGVAPGVSGIHQETPFWMLDQETENRRKCFQREGLHATTMPQVIQASGLSTGAVYSYFKNKEDIIQAALMASMLELSDLLQPILRSEPRPAPGALLCQITEAIVHFSARDGFDLKRLALLGWSEAQRNDRLRASTRTFYLAFRNDLADSAKGWQRAGMIDSSAEVEDVAKALLALVLGFVVQSAIVGEVEPEMISRGLSWLGTGATEKGVAP